MGKKDEIGFKMDHSVHQIQPPLATNSILYNYYTIPFITHQIPPLLLLGNLLRTSLLCLEASIQSPAYAWTIHILLFLC